MARLGLGCARGSRSSSMNKALPTGGILRGCGSCRLSGVSFQFHGLRASPPGNGLGVEAVPGFKVSRWRHSRSSSTPRFLGGAEAEKEMSLQRSRPCRAGEGKRAASCREAGGSVSTPRAAVRRMRALFRPSRPAARRARQERKAAAVKEDKGFARKRKAAAKANKAKARSQVHAANYPHRFSRDSRSRGARNSRVRIHTGPVRGRRCVRLPPASWA